MSLKTKFYLVGWLFVYTTLPNTLQANIPFLQKDLTEVRQMAAQEGKLYFAHFSAEWCMVCDWMEENTFTDPTLEAFVQDNYLPVRINFDEVQNQRYNEQFQIKVLPTILVFNSQGILLDKIQYSIEANELLRVLQKHNLARNKVSENLEPTEEVLNSPGRNLVLHRPALQLEKSEETYIANSMEPTVVSNGFLDEFEQIASAEPSESYNNSPKIKTMPNEVEVESAPSSVTDTPLYYHAIEMPPANPPALSDLVPNTDVMAPRSSRKYYVELGVHRDYDRAQQQKIDLEKQLDEKLHLISTVIRDQTLYKVITAEFPDFSSAQKHYGTLKEKSVFGLIQLVD
ncbi:MAG: thioredoxin family protein [Saprospiraceae bacterium]|nr:thioredoxin family protein [Saprospiraceae bacterium]